MAGGVDVGPGVLIDEPAGEGAVDQDGQLAGGRGEGLGLADAERSDTSLNALVRRHRLHLRVPHSSAERILDSEQAFVHLTQSDGAVVDIPDAVPDLFEANVLSFEQM